MLRLLVGLLAGAIPILLHVFLLITNLRQRVCRKLCLLRCASGENADQTCRSHLEQKKLSVVHKIADETHTKHL